MPSPADDRSDQPTEVPGSPAPLICWTRGSWIVLGVVLLAFLVVNVFTLHGFSLASWHTLIDGSSFDEVLAGQVRYIRGDDFNITIPLALAQCVHEPAFPVINTNIGDGLNMLLPLNLPVWHPVTLVRPPVWGFFLGKDVGLSWYWWTRILGLFYVYFLVFQVVSKNRFWLSLLAAACVVFSPLLQFWSFHFYAETATYMGLIYLCLTHLSVARRKASLVGWSLLLGWSGAAFCLTLYPPGQVAMAYIGLFMLLAFAIERRGELTLRRNRLALLAGSVAAASIALFFIGTFLASTHDAMLAMSNTEYPGQRVATGGGFTCWQLFDGTFARALQGVKQWSSNNGYYSNICNTSSFVLFFPVVAALLLYSAISRRASIDWHSALLLVCPLLFVVFMVVGFPERLASWTLFSKVPDLKAKFGLGMADLVLLVSFLSRRRGRFDFGYTMVGATLCIAWLAVMFTSGQSVQQYLPEITLRGVLIASCVAAGLAWLLCRQREVLFAGGLACFLAYSTLWFNPLAKGGTQFLYENDLSQQILKMHRESKETSRWVVFARGAEFSNLLFALGVPVIGGVHVYPQLDTWAQLDPQGEYHSAYNRYAHVRFMQQPSAQRIVSPQCDCCDVYLQPDDPALARLNVTHALFIGDQTNQPRPADLPPLYASDRETASHPMQIQVICAMKSQQTPHLSSRPPPSKLR